MATLLILLRISWLWVDSSILVAGLNRYVLALWPFRFLHVLFSASNFILGSRILLTLHLEALGKNFDVVTANPPPDAQDESLNMSGWWVFVLWDMRDEL